MKAKGGAPAVAKDVERMKTKKSEWRNGTAKYKDPDARQEAKAQALKEYDDLEQEFTEQANINQKFSTEGKEQFTKTRWRNTQTRDEDADPDECDEEWDQAYHEQFEKGMDMKNWRSEACAWFATNKSQEERKGTETRDGTRVTTTKKITGTSSATSFYFIFV